MRVPAFATAVLAIAAGALAPSLIGDLPEVQPGQVGMTEDQYDVDEVDIFTGDTVTFVNNSAFLHVLAPGEAARLEAQSGIPPLDHDLDTHISMAGDVYTTGRWNTPGDYNMTCTLHPAMTVTINVRAR